MKRKLRSLAGALAAGWVLAGLPGGVQAYPPAPHHEFFGVIRDAFGTPIDTPAARVVFESAAGVSVEGTVVPDRADGLNYVLTVPMDAGLTADLYRPTAMKPLVPFKLRVLIGRAVYLPIEMSGDFARLGKPGERTRVDLTLGEDSDGDGLPDAWELALLAQMGAGFGLEDIRPGDDLDGDGLSNLAEYLAGTYAHDRNQTFTLSVLGTGEGGTALEFMAIAGRTYAIEAADALGDWAPVRFHVAGATEPVPGYPAKDTRVIRVQVASPAEAQRFFRLRVQ